MGKIAVEFQSRATAPKLYSQAALDEMVLDAVTNEDERFLGLALLAGGSPDAKLPSIGTYIPAISLAACDGNRKIMRLLVDFGADVDATDKQGQDRDH